jgi:hypothetical protein
MKPTEELRNVIMRLSENVDLVAYADWVFRKSGKAKRLSEKDPWRYTRLYLMDYGDPSDLDTLMAIFADVGIGNESEALAWIFRNDEHIP